MGSEVFCIDSMLWRNKTLNSSLNGMFINSVYEESIDSCRLALSVIPYTDHGRFVMLSLLADEEVDIPIRKIAFAYVSRSSLSLVAEPVQFTRSLPVYDGTVEQQVHGHLESLRTSDTMKLYKRYKEEISDNLPIFPVTKKAVAALKTTTADIFGLDETCLGSVDLWMQESHNIRSDRNQIDITKRSTTESRNYYNIVPPKEPVVLYNTAVDAPGVHDQLGLDDFDQVNQVIHDCLVRARKDIKWLAIPSHRCMVLLLVTTVRNAVKGNMPWPSRQELMSRIQSVTKLMEAEE